MIYAKKWPTEYMCKFGWGGTWISISGSVQYPAQNPTDHLFGSDDLMGSSNSNEEILARIPHIVDPSFYGTKEGRPKLKNVHATFSITFRHLPDEYTVPAVIHCTRRTNHALLPSNRRVQRLRKHTYSLHAAMGAKEPLKKIELVGTEILEQEEWINRELILPKLMQSTPAPSIVGFTPDNFPDFLFFAIKICPFVFGIIIT